MQDRMQLGYALPLVDVGGEPQVVRTIALTAESLGYDYLAAPDHVLGVNAASRPDWGERNTSADLFHDPFVLFGFLAAATRRVGFSTEVMILAQRQTALVAKQAASLDVLSGGRFRFGIGIGWNPVEFTGLNENFHNRGRRSEEQVQVLQALWAEPHVSFEGKWHRIEDAGINPLPTRRRVPLWFGGHADVTLRRAAKWGDGWMMLAYPPGEAALTAFATFRRYCEEAGRAPGTVQISVRTSAGGTPEDWRREVAFWKAAGVSHLTLHNAYGRQHHHRIADRSLDAHQALLRRYVDAVRDIL
jgi:probable F420-dependent oxidoreductase